VAINGSANGFREPRAPVPGLEPGLDPSLRSRLRRAMPPT
jgi:hypothetical protein